MGHEGHIQLTVSHGDKSGASQGFQGVLLFTNDTTMTPEVVKQYTTPTSASSDSDLGSVAKAMAAKFFAGVHGPHLLVGKATDLTGDIDPSKVSDDMDAIVAACVTADIDFYSVVCSSMTEAVLTALSTKCQTLKKQLVVRSNDADIPAGTTPNAFNTIKTALEDTFQLYHATASEYPDMILAAMKSAVNPDATKGRGSTSWGYTEVGATPQGAIAADATKLAQIEAYNSNVLLTTAGRVCVGTGVLASGYYPNEILGQRWLETRLREAILGLLIREATAGRGVPYTQAGFTALSNQIEKIFGLGVDAGHFKSFVFDQPKRSEATVADATALIYRWAAQAIFAGMIVDVVGAVYLTRS